ncbi:MAG: hypothetical protein RLZZ508_976 [Actinomycetota bacterium]|jgi:copper ion binding protein
MTTTQIKVSGMTCGHCVNSVTEELQTISGVTQVNVDLESGNITIESGTELDADQIEAAIKEAGYEVVGA